MYNILEIEKQVLGSILLEPEHISEIKTILRASDFTLQTHKDIYNTILCLHDKREEINPFTVAFNSGKKESTYESSLTEDIISASLCISVAGIIKKESMKRETIESVSRFLRDVNETNDIAGCISSLETELFKINTSSFSKDLKTISSTLHQTITNIEKRMDSREVVFGVKSGFQDLDYLTCGFQDSDLIILAGRPSMGKTAIALDIMLNSNIPVAFFSLEMPDRQLAMRMLSGRTNIDSHRVRTGNIDNEEYNKLLNCAANLASKNIFLDDTAGISIEEIVAKAKKIKTKHDIKMVIIDYIQLITTNGKHQSREQEVSYISRQLKGLARDLHVPVIALSQLNRNLEQRVDKRPNLSDLRESGSLEQDADLVLFMYRHEVYEPEDEESKNKAELIISKHRNGSLGVIPLYFKKEISSFKSMSNENIS